MKLKLFESPHEFHSKVHDWLLLNEGVNTVALGVLDSQTSDSPRYSEAYYGAVFQGDDLVGTGIMTPPHPFNINGTTTDVIPHFVEMAKQLPKPKSVLGPGSFAKEFADLWRKEVDCAIGHEEAQAIHKLLNVNHPESGRGKIILADEVHRLILEEWSRGFLVDCDMEDDLPEVPNYVSRALKDGSRFLLIVDGKPVSMAGRAREIKNGGTVNWVYTPKSERKRGYASELVAGLSQIILDSGKEAVYLYTQLDNPTSNKIYYDIGYRVISDSWHIRFDYC